MAELQLQSSIQILQTYNNFYVYCLHRPDRRDPLTLTVGQPFYVGKGSNGRLSDHRHEAEKLLHTPGRKIYKINIIHSLWKQGLDFKEVIIKNNLTEQEAFAIEKRLIKIYGRVNMQTGCLSNMTDGGDGPAGRIPWNQGVPRSEKVKQKIRETNLGRVLTEEHKRKIGQGCKGKVSWIKGKTHKEETKRKISQTLKGVACPARGKPCSEEKKEKLRKSLKGRPKELTLAQRKAKSDRMKGNNFNVGRRHSEETKQKMRKAQMGHAVSDESRQKMSDAKKGYIPWNKGKKLCNG